MSQTSDEFFKGIWKENPVFVHVLGLCPMLAVTNTAINALAMGLATFFVLLGSSTLVSMLRHFNSQNRYAFPVILLLSPLL